MASSISHIPFVASLAFLLGTVTLAQSSDAFRIRRVAVSGDPAPQTESGTIFFDADFTVAPGVASRIDRLGNVAFGAFVVGPNVQRNTNGSGIWKTIGNALTLVARQGQAAPGTAPGTVFNRFDNLFQPVPPAISGGHVAFVANLRGPAVTPENSLGIWTDSPGALVKVVQSGDLAPGLSNGSVFIDFTETIDHLGNVAFNGSFAAPGEPFDDPNREGFWIQRSGALQLIARGGISAPGTTNRVTFGQGGFFAVGGAFRSWSLDSGRVAFHGNLTGGGVDDLNDEGIWVETDSGLKLIAREGDPAPGFGAGVRFGAITGIDAFDSNLLISATGAVVFQAIVSGGEIDFANALYSTRATGVPHLLTRGAVIQLSVNGRDQVAFNGATDGSAFGIWSDRTGSLVPIALKGSQVPGLEQGVVFGNPEDFSNDFLLTGLSASGHVSFAARLSGPGVDSRNNVAFFVSDPDGVMRIAARVGSLFQLSASDIRQIFDGRFVGISDVGEVDATLFFSDGTRGVFTLCDPICQAPPPLPPPLPRTPPPPTQIFLEGAGRKKKGKLSVDLSWRGAYAASVVIFRNGARLLTTANDGVHRDSVSRRGRYDYQVCESGTGACSAMLSVVVG